MRFPAVIAASLLVLGLSACGASTTTTTVTSVPAGSTSTSGTVTTPSTTTAASSSTSTATTTTAAGPAPCVAADLSGAFLGQQGATGHGVLGFAVRNSSAKSCKTFGYPGIQFLGKSGQALPTVPMHTTHDFFGPAPKVAIVLAPGQSASFRLGVTHGAVPGLPCTTAYGLQVIAPDDTATLRIPITGGAYECRDATVSPMRPGNSAYP